MTDTFVRRARGAIEMLQAELEVQRDHHATAVQQFEERAAESGAALEDARAQVARLLQELEAQREAQRVAQRAAQRVAQHDSATTASGLSTQPDADAPQMQPAPAAPTATPVRLDPPSSATPEKSVHLSAARVPPESRAAPRPPRDPARTRDCTIMNARAAISARAAFDFLDAIQA